MAIAAVIMLACCILPVSGDSDAAGSESDVVYKDGYAYETLNEAVESVDSGQTATIELSGDIVMIEKAVIAEGASVILDMNGHSITVTESFETRPLENYGTLVVTGNGTIDSTNAGSMGFGAIANYGDLTIYDGTYNGNIQSGGAAIRTYAGSSTIIYNGTFLGSPSCVNSEGYCEIYDGVFRSTSCSSCYPNSWGYAVRNTGGIMYFYGGHVTGTQGAIAAASGYTEIHDGTFTTVHCPRVESHTADFYALYVAGEYNAVSTKVYGGKFQSYSRECVQVGNSGDGGIEAVATLEIHGGSYSVYKNDTIDVIDVDYNTANVPSAIVYEGQFDRQITKDIVAEGSTIVGNLIYTPTTPSDDDKVSSGNTNVDLVSDSDTVTAGVSESASQVTVTGTLTTNGSVPKEVTLSFRGDVTEGFVSMTATELRTEVAVVKAQANPENLVAVFDFSVKGSISDDYLLTVTVPLDVPEGHEVSDVWVMFYADDGTVEKHQAEYADGSLTFTTTHNSMYCIYAEYTQEFVPPIIWDDDDDYVPPIVPVQPEDSGDDNTTTIVACAAAAVVAALIAAFLIIDRRQ